MTDFVAELGTVIAFARKWLGRDPTEDETRKLVTWLEQEVAASKSSPNPIDAGLAAATAVIAEGRDAADNAMKSALSAALSAERHSEASNAPPPPPGPPGLQQQVQQTAQELLNGAPEGTSPQDAVPELLGYIGQIIEAEVARQMAVKLVELEAKADVKLTEISHAAVEICDKLSADIREQLARDMTAKARGAAQRKTR